MAIQTKKNLLIPPFLVFYLVHSSQFGIGMLGFTRYITESAGYQAWIAVILTGFLFHFVVYASYQLLTETNQDLMLIHRNMFGSVFGAILTVLFVLYIFLLSITVLRTYIEIVQIWIFPDLPTWALTVTILLAVYYAILNGFRVVTGICFLGVIIPFFLTFTAFAPLEFATYRNVLPLFHTSIGEQLQAMGAMTFSYLGPELILVYFPFIQNRSKSQKYAHYGVAFTTLLYVFITFITFVFYSKDQLLTTVWPTLSLWKVLELPFIERFEYIGISVFMLVILPNITLCIWACSRLLKNQLNIAQRKTLLFVLILAFSVTIAFKTRDQIDLLHSMTSIAGQIIIFIYLPLLLVITIVKRRLGR